MNLDLAIHPHYLQLDIYYPQETSESSSSGKTPILFFIYGGGFTTGDRSFPPPADLAYANVATYFAQRGFITVIPDYRLVPDVIFPAPAQDVRDAMEWVIAHPENLIFGNVTNPDVDSIFIFGHSAGALHAFTMLTLPELNSPTLHPKIKGAVLMSGPYRFDRTSGFDEIAVQYWGSLEETDKKDCLGLLRNLSPEQRKSLPSILLIEAERDPGWMQVVGKEFHEALLAHSEIKVKKIYAKGHNHISCTLCMGSNEGEEFAEETVEWMRDIL